MDIDSIPIGLIITGLIVPTMIYAIMVDLIDVTSGYGVLIYAMAMMIAILGIIITVFSDWMIPIPNRTSQSTSNVSEKQK